MTRDPVVLPESATVRQAARAMWENDIGAVIVNRNGQVVGVVTDRDITVRAIASGMQPDKTRLGDICSRRLVAVSPDEPVEQIVDTMRRKALRRLPVLEDGKPVGIVALGDLAIQRDPDSTLAAISAAPPNR
jgi:CBS domain-containing protein